MIGRNFVFRRNSIVRILVELLKTFKNDLFICSKTIILKIKKNIKEKHLIYILNL